MCNQEQKKQSALLNPPPLDLGNSIKYSTFCSISMYLVSHVYSKLGWIKPCPPVGSGPKKAEAPEKRYLHPHIRHWKLSSSSTYNQRVKQSPHVLAIQS